MLSDRPTHVGIMNACLTQKKCCIHLAWTTMLELKSISEVRRAIHLCTHASCDMYHTCIYIHVWHRCMRVSSLSMCTSCTHVKSTIDTCLTREIGSADLARTVKPSSSKQQHEDAAALIKRWTMKEATRTEIASCCKVCICVSASVRVRMPLHESLPAHSSSTQVCA